MEERENDEDVEVTPTRVPFVISETETEDEAEFRREALNQKHYTDSLSGLI